MQQLQFTVPIDIKANKERVWAAITDFNTYAQWNSILSLSGNNNLEIGKKFHVVIHEGSKDSKFDATLLSKKEGYSFSAEQKILSKWFFAATHHFIIESTGKNTRFIQHWELSGFISRLFKKQIFRQLALFNQMNLELKNLLEKPKTTHN